METEVIFVDGFFKKEVCRLSLHARYIEIISDASENGVLSKDNVDQVVVSVKENPELTFYTKDRTYAFQFRDSEALPRVSNALLKLFDDRYSEEWVL